MICTCTVYSRLPMLGKENDQIATIICNSTKDLILVLKAKLSICVKLGQSSQILNAHSALTVYVPCTVLRIIAHHKSNTNTVIIHNPAVLIQVAVQGKRPCMLNTPSSSIERKRVFKLYKGVQMCPNEDKYTMFWNDLQNTCIGLYCCTPFSGAKLH